jgi:peptide-methionine (R)-S-oxide reductase
MVEPVLHPMEGGPVTTEDIYKQKLSPEQYAVLREKATERPWTGKLLKEKRPGTFVCGACGAQLFSSDTKYESGSGWPSFYDAIDDGAILQETDTTHGMVRTEIMCAKCGSHLGHVFDDGPNPTGQRYCVNSLSLDFEPFDVGQEPAN